MGFGRTRPGPAQPEKKLKNGRGRTDGKGYMRASIRPR